MPSPSGTEGIETLVKMTAAERRVSRGFDRLSGIYDMLARLLPGDPLPRSQGVHLEPVVDRTRRTDRAEALVVGGGTGEFLLALFDAGFRGQVTYVDLSMGMLRRARSRLIREAPARLADVRFVQGGVERIPEAARFDLVCTHYFLDLFTESEMMQAISGLDRMLRPGGVWLCSDFAGPGGSRLQSALRSSLVCGLYVFFGIACGIRARRLPPIREAFRRFGYEAVHDASLAGGLVWSALFERRQGTANSKRVGRPFAGPSNTISVS